MAQNDKDYVFHMPCLRNHTYYDCHLWYTCVKWWYLQTYFWVSGFLGGKRAKKVQNDHFCLLHSISQEPYIIWSSFVVHKRELIYLQVCFHFFKILIFRLVRRVKGQKIGPKWRKALSVVPYISGKIYHMIFICYAQE